MSHLILPRGEIWTRQPQGDVEIDWRNPITRGLADGFLRPARSLTGLSIASALPISVDRQLSFISASSSSIATINGFKIPETEGITVVLIAKRSGNQPDSGFGTTFLFPKISGAADSFLHFIKSGSVGERIRVNFTGDDATSNFWETNVDWPVGVWQVGAYTAAAGATPGMYRNGVKLSLSSSAGILASGVVKPSLDMQINFAALRLNGSIGGVIVFKRVLIDAEIRSISDNPWQIFASRKTSLFVPVSAGGGSTLNASATGQATASGTATLATQVALAAIGVALADGAATAAVQIPLAAAGISIADGTANAQATVTLSAAGLALAAGQAGLSASVLLQAAGAAQASGNAPLAAQLTALAAGAAQATGTANLTGGAPGELNASGQAQADGSAALSVTVSVSATGGDVASGSANLSGGAPGQVSASGGAQADGSAVASATVALTAAGFVAAMGTGTWSVTVPLSAFGGAVTSGGAHLTELGNIVFTRAPSGAGPAPLISSGRRIAQSNQARPANTGGRR